MKSRTSTLWISAFVLVTAAFMSVTAGARAQGAAAATLDKATVSTDAAKRTLTKMQINAETARAIVDACVQFGKASNTSYSVFVLAPNGDIVDAHVMDGQLPIGVETALLKAKTAL